MSTYRPLTDFWMLARCKYKNGVKRYGGYLGGFPERARALLAVNIDEPMLHVCGGMARSYPYKAGFGPADKTLDLDPDCKPDYLQDALAPMPTGFRAMLMDPPYSPEDAAHYVPGTDRYPQPNALLLNAMKALKPGQRVGLIHYILPSPPKGSRFIAAVGVCCGFNNRIRIFSVFERGAEPLPKKAEVAPKVSTPMPSGWNKKYLF